MHLIIYSIFPSEEIDSAHGGLRRPEVMLPHGVDPPAATRARVRVRLQVKIAHADGGLHVPMLAQYPVVAVADAHAGAPALVTLAASAQPVDIGYIITCRPRKWP